LLPIGRGVAARYLNAQFIEETNLEPRSRVQIGSVVIKTGFPLARE
jgi:hypothetical protein